MATEIKIPIPDQTTEEVRIVKWHKAKGDTVSAGQVILEVETDKSVIEVEAVAAGEMLAVFYEVDDMVPVGQVVGAIGQVGEAYDTPNAAREVGVQEHVPPTTSSDGNLPEGVVEVKIPIPDQTTEEVRVVKWHKAVGDSVKPGEVILEVETDKSVIEVEAAGGGSLLSHLYQEEDMVPVGKVVGHLGPTGTTVNVTVAAKPAEKAAEVSSAPVAVAASSAEPIVPSGVKASPIARNMAGCLGVDLTLVKGTGPGGRITRDDVERFAANPIPAAVSGGAAVLPVVAKMIDGRIMASPNAKRLAKKLNVDLQYVKGTGGHGRIIGDDVEKFAASGVQHATAASVAGGAYEPVSMLPAAGQPQPGTEIELTKMRRAIGVNLQKSFRDTPHFNVTMAIDMSRALEFRKGINLGRQKAQSISVNDLILRAVAVALRQYPMVNSRLTENSISVLPDVNVGVATAIETGLVVPVLTNADKRDWVDMAVETKKLAAEARRGKILNAGKGTFTVSNLGMFGVEEFTAIINPPESAILAVGGTQNEVVAIEGGMGVRPVMRVTLCSDHRVIDGALAAQFLQAVKKYLELQIA